MELKNKTSLITNYPLLTAVRKFLGEAAIGLMVSWMILFLLELMRPGIASLHIDLNLLLVLGALAWLAGTKAQVNKVSWYASLTIFAILLVLLLGVFS